MSGTSLMDEAEKQVGTLLLTGFEGKTLADDTAAFISQAGVGGVIYFAHNYETPEQILELSQQVQECRKNLPLWIGVDHEGGRVQRFKAPFTLVPPAAKIGKTNSPKLIFEVAQLVAKELSAVGINLNFAPVADILTLSSNPVIGDRAYGTTEEEVSRMVTACVRGFLTNGVQACVKHFPGHGDTSVDSHLGLPKINTPLETLRNREFKPFTKASKSHCSMIMTAHIINTTIDPEYPATLSKKTLTDLLRGELRYNRIIISDDMEMDAITQHFGAEQAPVLAIQAGCDLLCYRSEKAARKAYEALIQALREERLSATRILESVSRINDLKKKFLVSEKSEETKNDLNIIGCEEHQKIVASIQ